jgi:hypothetical protein
MQEYELQQYGPMLKKYGHPHGWVTILRSTDLDFLRKRMDRPHMDGRKRHLRILGDFYLTA